MWFWDLICYIYKVSLKDNKHNQRPLSDQAEVKHEKKAQRMISYEEQVLASY